MRLSVPLLGMFIIIQGPFKCYVTQWVGGGGGVPISITMVYVPTLSALLEGGGVKFLEKALCNI